MTIILTCDTKLRSNFPFDRKHAVNLLLLYVYKLLNGKIDPSNFQSVSCPTKRAIPFRNEMSTSHFGGGEPNLRLMSLVYFDHFFIFYNVIMYYI